MSTSNKILLGTAGAVGTTIASWRLFFPYIADDIQCIRNARKTAEATTKAISEDKRIIDMFEASVARHPKKTFVIFEDKHYTYEFVDKMANRIANVASTWNVTWRDTVSVMIYNEPAFVWTFLGLQKLGIASAFVNFNLKSKTLAHSIQSSEAKILIVGEGDELLEAIDEIKMDIAEMPIYVLGKSQSQLSERYVSLDELLLSSIPVPVCRVVRQCVPNTSPLCYISTSGTTGLPKPAIINQHKAIGLAKSLQLINYNKNDIVYVVTPLYHSAATTVGLWNTLDVGATIVIARKFSARKYFEEVRKHDVTVIQYIGELCRYLLRVPKTEFDQIHKLRCAFGNGLRRDIWDEFKTRFNIPWIVEFFGATEGTTGIWSGLNKPGSVGRLSPLTRHFRPRNAVQSFLIRYDPLTYEPLRDTQGLCILAKPGENGLIISGIPSYIKLDSFYKGTKAMNEKKLVRNVFKDSDVFFSFGDIFHMDKQYYLYFKDRVGDTFRWKSENVSTREVCDVLSTLSFLHDVNVYGVAIPGEDGRAGMAAITLHDGNVISPKLLKSIYRKVQHELPSYARPVFLRFIQEQVVTETMKHRKVDFVKEGFDPNIVSEPLYVIDNTTKTYIPLTTANYNKVLHSRL